MFRNSTITDVSVYEVYPLSSSPEFVRIAQRSNVNVLYSPGAFAATQYCIALSHASGCLTVWDFVLDSVVTWRVDADENPVCSPCNLPPLVSDNVPFTGLQG